MSRHSLILEKAASEASPPNRTTEPLPKIPRPGVYAEMVRRFFHGRAVIAVMAAGSGRAAAHICGRLAADLAASGNRVVVADVSAMLHMGPLCDPAACHPGAAPNVWTWPSPAGERVEFFKSAPPAASADNLIQSLRRVFDSVLLACPAPETEPAAAGIAALADAVVLAAEAGQTTKQQVGRAQRELQSAGATLAGCILLRRS
jgi:Mrp family chromosome partitioning ATPase